MNSEDIADVIKNAFVYPLMVGSIAVTLLTSPHYKEERKPGEFRRPEARLVDFVPIYGMFTYTNRWREIKSFNEFIDYYSEFFKRVSLEDAVSFGTASWKAYPDSEYRHAKEITALQNGFMGSYHIVLPLMVAMEIFLRKKKEESPVQNKILKR